MNILAYLGLIVMAAETVISPVPDPLPFTDTAHSPGVTFGVLSGQSVLSASVISETPAPVPEKPRLTKTVFSITLLGDSMIDTLGPDGAGLGRLLAADHPGVSFTVRNAGTGGTGIDYGQYRLTNGYSYLGAEYHSVLSDQPDILVVESFAYNPPTVTTGLLDTHWTRLADIIDTVRDVSPETKIVLAATISPNSELFGDGAPGLTFDQEDKRNRTAVIRSLLDNTVRFAESQNLPIANAYNPSLTPDNNGNPDFINAGDHIHYSPKGAAFFTQILARTILDSGVLL